MIVQRPIDPLFLLTLGVYVLAVTGIGYYGFARTDDEADFLVAGREVGPLVGGATLAATQMSAGTFVGAFGIHYLFGAGFIWVWTGLWTGWLVTLILVAPQMRRLGKMTVPDYLAARYADDGADGDYVRALAAALIVVVYTVFLTAQLTAGGLVFRAVFAVPETVGIAAMVVVSIAYTMIGGMRASVLTDFLQAAVMLGGLLVAVPLALQTVGGLSNLESILRSIDPSLVGQSFSGNDIAGFFIAFALVRVASPRAVSRFYAMRDERTVRRSIVVCIGIQTIVAVSVAVLGLSTRTMFPELGTPDLASVMMGLRLLDPILGGLFIAAILSATLSTVDSIVIVSASAIAHDIYGKLLNPSASERQKLRANRLAVLVVGIVPLTLALNRELVGGLVQFIAILQASMMASTFFAPFLLGLHWKRANTPGSVAGMVSGFVTVVVWHLGTEVFEYIPTRISDLVGDPVVPGAVVSIVAFVVVSLLTGSPSRRSLSAVFQDEQQPQDD
jgi:SSS family transporter